MNQESGSQTPQKYKLTLFDRMGPDAGVVLRSLSYSGVMFVCFLLLFSALSDKEDFSGLWVLPLAAIATAGAMYAGYRFGVLAGVGFSTFTLPTGNSTPYEQQFSYQESLAIRGDPGAALESFEELILATPIPARDGVELRVKAAEMAIRAGQPRRATELFREVQRADHGDVGRDLYVSNRLIDLFIGPLADPGRAMVELRRLVERYPATDTASRARAALERMKRERPA
jgi:hypothetical protein